MVSLRTTSRADRTPLANAPLPAKPPRFYRLCIARGEPGFTALVAMFGLMITKPGA